MSRDPQLRLLDVIEACDRLQSYIQGICATDFNKDLKTQDAIIRMFSKGKKARSPKTSTRVLAEFV